ncbi:metal-dependent hydrolase [Halococcus agarilyticus]|uniref:metal-dependent hydrolase n=1 Tax=Halococcus agarilyticus TaxID=1232219 RepID=UPI000677706E|nr:metal-dependent hydrolase [Halococcus agarilyticus]
MPSTVVHCALAGLLAASLLGDVFDARAVAVVLGVTILPDLDAFAGFFIDGGHRSVLHTLLLPLGAAALLYADTRLRDRSFVRGRWRARGVRIAWVSVAAVAFAAIGLDLVAGGVNLLYPIHDQFYALSGELLFSNNRGLVQTFVELGGGESGAARGSTEQVHINSGVDPTRGAEPENVERVFPVAQSGWQLLLILTSVFVLGVRLWDDR